MKGKEQGLGIIIGIAMGALIFMDSIFIGTPVGLAAVFVGFSIWAILMTTWPIGEHGGFAEEIRRLNPQIDRKIISQMSYRQSDVISNIFFWFMGFIVPCMLMFIAFREFDIK